MEITNVVLFVGINNEDKVRQVLLDSKERKIFISMISAGVLPCETVKISSDALDVLKFTDKTEESK